MEDGGSLERLRRYGVRKRAGMKGPMTRAAYRLCTGKAKFLLWWWPDGTIRPVAVWPAIAGRGYADQSTPLWRRPRMRKVKAASPGDAPRNHASLNPGALDKLPGLIDHLAVIKYDDDSPRQVGAIRVTTEGFEWCVRVSDPDSACSFVARAETLWDAILLAELLVTSERCPWSPDSFLADRAARKKKK